MRTALLLIALVALATPVEAHDCTSWRTSVTDETMIVIELPEVFGGAMYLANDLCNVPRPDENGSIVVEFGHEFARVPAPVSMGSCAFSIWSYQESNGISGLQRADEMRDDTCHWMIEGDTLAFF